MQNDGPWQEPPQSYPQEERGEKRLDYLLIEKSSHPCNLKKEDAQELRRLREALGRNEVRGHRERHAYFRFLARQENPELFEGVKD